jgi:hypothetical protein
LLIKLCGISLYAAVLLYFWKKRKSSDAAISHELAVAALVSLLISPLTWRHHFVLVLLPLICLWMQSRQYGGKLRLLALALISFALGTPFADFTLLHLHNGFLQALLSSVFLLAGCALLLLYLLDYRQLDSIPASNSRDPAVEELGRVA